jgi:hypothetical protein
LINKPIETITIKILPMKNKEIIKQRKGDVGPSPFQNKQLPWPGAPK